MKHKGWVIAGIATLGAVPMAWYLLKKITNITVPNLSPEWLATAEYDRDGFKD